MDRFLASAYLPDMALPTLSIVIEYENAARIGCDRARRMLEQLQRQLADLPPALIGDCEILFVYHAEEVDDAWLKATIAQLQPWRATLRYMPCSISGYYEQKNFGASETVGDIIVYLDSDVIPREGWLSGLLEPIAAGTAKIVAGSTSVERFGFYSTAMAVGWIFPLSLDANRPGQTAHFFANNVAFRREMIDAMRFPDALQYRVQVGDVHRSLARHGHHVLMSGAAVLHPPPLGLSGFVTRGLWCGYDSSTRIARGSNALWKAPLAFGREMLAAFRRVVLDRGKVGLGVIGTAGALAVIGAYHLCRLFGFVAGLFAPGWTWRHLKRIAP